MVSQKLVQEAMEAINEPCTTQDILDYLEKNNLIATNYNFDPKIDIAYVLKILKKWEITDRLPQGHAKNHHSIWFLRKNGNPHPDKCPKCKLMRNAFTIMNNELIAAGIQGKVRNHGEDIPLERQKARFGHYD